MRAPALHANIPRSFSLGGTRWRVKAMVHTDTWGMCHYDAGTIQICTSMNGEAVPYQQQLRTFVHEAYHAIMFTLGKGESEEMVTALENMTWQILTSMRLTATKKSLPP